jgi:hypothetical protein
MRKYINSGLFSVVILLFFLPFMEVRCNNDKIVHATGVAMALNLKFETNSQLGGLGGMMNKNDELQSALDSGKRKPDVFGLITLFLLHVGIIFQFIPVLQKPWMSAILAGVAALSLSLMYFIYTSGWEEKISSIRGAEIGGFMNFTLHFVYGYWLALLGCIGLLAYNIFNQIQDNRAKAIAVYYPVTKDEAPDIIDNF